MCGESQYFHRMKKTPRLSSVMHIEKGSHDATFTEVTDNLWTDVNTGLGDGNSYIVRPAAHVLKRWDHVGEVGGGAEVVVHDISVRGLCE